jgi:amino acid transporter
MYCPIDGVVHLVEDVKRPRIIVPRAILTALTLSFISATAFGIATTYCISDFETALMSRTGFPAFEIWRQAMNSDAWAVAFVVFLLVMVPASTLTTTQVVSRMTWSFANDQALLFSDFLKVVSPKLKVPLRALLFNAGLVFLIGCLYLISSTGKCHSIVYLRHVLTPSPSLYCHLEHLGGVPANHTCVSLGAPDLPPARSRIPSKEQTLQSAQCNRLDV